jgi:aminoglycoside/choline kinase family phosphotransferase
VTAPPPSPPLTERVAALVRGTGDLRLTPLAGDASNRRYFRVTRGEKRFVLMQMANPEDFKRSEEAVTGTVPAEVTGGEPPFLNMQRYLRRAGCPVPDVRGVDLAHGLILLEDLGDVSLMAAIAEADPGAVEALYAEAVDGLARLQRDTPLDDECIAAHRTFAPELLAWEFDHFVEYGLEARHERSLTDADRDALAAAFGRLAEEIAAAPTVLVHRDYHSRNLLVRPDGRLGLIDFQDALMGPVTYDLASLLWDPYVRLPDGLAGRLAGRYRSQAPVPLPDDFDTLLARTALQRLLKAAGRFVYIDRVKGNPAFLKDVPACLMRARAILAADTGLADLWEMLGRLEPALAPA